MKRYFIHQLKSHSRAIIIITVLMMLVSFFVAVDTMRYEHEHYYVTDGENWYDAYVEDGKPTRYHSYANQDGYVDVIIITTEKIIEVKYHDLSLSYPAVILLLLSVTVPAWMFGFMKKKRNLDCLYSLPITKRGIGIAQYLLGLIAVFTPFVFSYAVMLICNAAHGLFGNIAHKYLVIHFLICILFGFIIYSLSCFAFDRANTVIDGIIMIGIYLFILYVLAYNIEIIVREIIYLNHLASHTYSSGMTPSHYYFALHNEGSVPFVLFVDLLETIESDAEQVYQCYTKTYFEQTKNVVWIIIWSVVGLLSTFGLIYGFEKKKAESAEEISSSIFCYKLIIPVISILFNVTNGIFDNDTTVCIVATIACVVAYTIYRRGFKYKIGDYIVIGLMILLTFCSLFVNEAIRDAVLPF